MFRRSVGFVLTLGFLLLASGCVELRAVTERPAIAAPGEEVSNVKGVIAEAPSHDTPALPFSHLLVTVDDEEGGLQARPVDPSTLDDLPGFAPLDFQHHYTHALSPDGRTLAAITWPSGSHNNGGRLQLTDLPTWTTEQRALTIDGYANSFLFGADGDILYWLQSRAGVRYAELNRYDKNTETLTVTNLPDAFSPWTMHILPEVGRLALFGVPTDEQYLSVGTPSVLLLDLDTHEVVADVELEGVQAGQFEIETTDENESRYRVRTPGRAWDLERGLLYIVPSDRDWVIVVGLHEGEIVREAAFRPRLSWLERLLTPFVSVASAKMVPGTERHALLSPDGSLLYLTGKAMELTRDEAGEWQWHETPLGLSVVATADLTMLHHLDLPQGEMALSPDGEWLLYAQRPPTFSTEETAPGPRFLYLFDATTLEEQAHLPVNAGLLVMGFSPDGRHAYIQQCAPSESRPGNHHWKGTLQVLNLDTREIVAERAAPGDTCAFSLIPIPS